MHCGRHLMDFIKYTKRGVKKVFEKSLKFLIDNIYCDAPDSMANINIKNLTLNDIKYSWSPTNKEDACNKICTCFEFPVALKIAADCSHRNLTHVPHLVGEYNNWAVELNLSENLIKN